VRTFTGENKRLVVDLVAEGAREIALLWFVFSALDALISGRVTLSWLTLNTCGSVIVWALGMYFEFIAKEMA
jgi:hypothetical protein